MPFKLYTDADKGEGPWPLACDPVVMKANPAEALLAYLEDSDHRLLVVPDDALRFGIRPLGEPELEDIEEAAGEVPFRGRQVQAMVRARMAEEGLTGREAKASLTPDELAAWRAYQAWEKHRTDLTLQAAVQTLDGEPFDVAAWLPTLGRKTVINQVRSELLAHVHNVTDLGLGPKEQSSLPSTSPSSATARGGAKTATPAQSFGGDEDTAASSPSAEA